MGFLRDLKNKVKAIGHDLQNSSNRDDDDGDERPPPEWSAAPEVSHKWGKWNEAPEAEYEAAETFCLENPPFAPRLLPSSAIERIGELGCRAWGLQYPLTPRFARGTIRNACGGDAKGAASSVTRVQTGEGCRDTCLLSDLPILAGLYEVQGKVGVYFEVLVEEMEGFIAIGTACRPYPEWRMPGWNRLSAGLHLDDLRKFYEDPDGGRDYLTPSPSSSSSSSSSPSSQLLTHISPRDTIGCGYEFASGALFYTYNGVRLPNAFAGLYLPRTAYDVYAAVGVEGRCVFEVNFGGEVFKWKEGNEWAWRVEGHVGRLSGAGGSGRGGGGGGGGQEEELPAYS